MSTEVGLDHPSDIMRLPDLAAYVRLVGGYPITQVKLQFKERQACAENILLQEVLIEQDNRIVKPIMEFKAFHSAEATLAGIELCRMLKKSQHINSENALHSSNFMR